MAEMMTYDQLVEELSDLTDELMNLHEELGDLIKAGNTMRRVTIVATIGTVICSGLYAREWFKNNRILRAEDGKFIRARKVSNAGADWTKAQNPVNKEGAC